MSFTIEVKNGKRFNQYPLLEAVGNESDIVLVRMADGTGIKALTLAVLKAWFTSDLDKAFGNLDDLTTEEKTTLVAAINEVVQNC